MIIQLEMTVEEKRILVQELKISRTKIEMALEHCKGLEKKDDRHISNLEKKLDVLSGTIHQLLK